MSTDTDEQQSRLELASSGHTVAQGSVSLASVEISPEQQREQNRLSLNRAYFEEGCACIHETKTLQPCPTNMSDQDAVAFYERHCTCTRNYL